MTITDYPSLKAAIISFSIDNNDPEFDARVSTFVQLAGARLNRELHLRAMEADEDLTGTTGSRLVPLPADCAEPVTLYLTTFGGFTELRSDVSGNMPLRAENGTPTAWATNDAQSIKLNCPGDQPHSFQLRYRKSLVLSEDHPTNWLVQNYPDLYLAACMVWGHVFGLAYQDAEPWKLILEEGMRELNWEEARSRRGVLKVDTALAGRGGFNIRSGD